MRRPPRRVILVSSFAGLTLVAGVITAWSWLGGHEPGEAPDSVASRAAATEPARLPSTATAALPVWTRRESGSAVQAVSASQSVRTTRLPAHVEPYEQSAIYAKAAGFVSVVHVDLGDRVKKGQVLAELWIPEMDQQLAQKKALVEEAQAAVGQAAAAIAAAESLVAAAAEKTREAQATVASHQAEIKFRNSEHDRFAELVRTSKAVEPKLVEEKLRQLESAEAALVAAEAGIASAQANERVEQARLKQAHANRALAQAKLKTAQADLKQTEVLMDYAVIRAPYDGVVTERLIDTGDFARSAGNGSAEPLFTVMRETPLRIVVDIPEADAGWVRTGLPATLSVDGIQNQPCACVVRRTAEMLDPKMHTLRIEVEVTERVEGLRPGMYGAVTITDSPTEQAGSVARPAAVPTEG